jgi:hypothetical protein
MPITSGNLAGESSCGLSTRCKSHRMNLYQGPGWISGQSTLLQVLISIQSLVMGVEEPALNEPGWSSLGGKPESIAYTKNCRRQTVAVAMLNQLKEPDSIWKDIIEGHFRLKARSLFVQLDRWLNEDDRRGNQRDGAALMHRHQAARLDGQDSSQSKFANDGEYCPVLFVILIRLHLFFSA